MRCPYEAQDFANYRLHLFCQKVAIVTEPWWLSGLMCQSIINPMLKVEGSNPGASILKFGLFQFSKCLRLDKNINLGFRLRC